jgi:hypothetical protein
MSEFRTLRRSGEEIKEPTKWNSNSLGGEGSSRISSFLTKLPRKSEIEKCAKLENYSKKIHQNFSHWVTIDRYPKKKSIENNSAGEI